MNLKNVVLVSSILLASAVQGESIQQAKSRAVNMLNSMAATMRSNELLRTRAYAFTNSATALQNATIKESNSSECDSQTIAYVYPSDRSTVYICQRAINEFTSPYAVSQVLLHESAHLAGYSNECLATSIEVAAYLNTFDQLAFYSAYIQQCYPDVYYEYQQYMSRHKI